MKEFVYDQSSGEFRMVNGGFELPLAVGYAGAGSGRNNPAAQSQRSVGPLPQGRYSLAVVPHRRFAAPAIRLTQIEGERYGRSAFYIHGDNADGTASTGCIVLSKGMRRLIAAALSVGWERLRVVG